MRFVVLTFFLIVHGAFGADTPPNDFEADVTKWVVVDCPSKVSKDEEVEDAYRAFMRCAANCKAEWTVFATAAGIQAKMARVDRRSAISERPAFSANEPKYNGPNKSPSSIIRVSDGWLIAYNRGEWGGSLWWFSNDGNENYRISSHQIIQFLRYRDRIFALDGLSHLGESRGTVIEIALAAKRWKVSTFVELPSCGVAISEVPDGRVCVLTSDMLFALALDKKLELLLPAPDWDSLAPSSLAVDAKAGVIYIGMRQFVARYRLNETNHEFQYSIPSKEFLNTKDE